MPNAVSRYAYLWVLCALFAASLEPIIIKIGYQHQLTPLQLLAFKSLFGAFVMVPLTRVWYWIGWTKVKRILTVATLLFFTNMSVLFALETLSAITVVTVITTTPAFVALVNHMRGRDKLTIRFWIGFGCCFFGVLLTVDVFGSDLAEVSSLGLIILVVGVISSTIYRTKMEKVTAFIPPKEVSAYIFIINGFYAAVFILPWIKPIPMEHLWIASWVGVAAALANVAFLAGIHLMGSTRMSIFDMLQRPIVVIAAAMVLQEPITLLQGVGILCVFLGVYLAKVERKPQPKTSEAIV